MKLSEDLWKDSQKNELYFWESQFKKNNEDQVQRNAYYLSKMEGHCDMIKRFVEENKLEDKTVMDLGSGPEGILHVIDCKYKIAVDPLMREFRSLGYDISANGVNAYTLKAEDLFEHFGEDYFDVIFCLNSIDHHQDPKLVIDQCYKVLKPGGHLILLTDTRLPEQCDAYHKLPLTKDYIDTWLGEYLILESQVFPHGPGNPIKQYIVHALKEG
jgi:SAM-dependent methyltransferase